MANKEKTLNYELRVEGHLDEQWRNWFDGMTITQDENGETLIYGPVIDQAALYGLLKKIRDLGMLLIPVNRKQTNKELSK